jgi:MarR family transcriptional regulator, temperature-dependent positive regulator of motility
MPDGEAQPQDAPLRMSLSHLLHRAQQVATDRFSAATGEGGLTLRQYAVLAAAAAKPGLSQSDLVSETGIDRSTLAEMVARMTKKGLLERNRSQTDARANSVSIAAEGVALLEAARPLAESVDAALLELLPKARRDGFLDLLGRFVEASLEAERLAAPASDRLADKGRPKKKEKTKTKKKKKKKPE